MPAATPQLERRQNPRIPAHGDVLVHANGKTIHGRLAAISESDIDVQCQLGFGLLGMAGQDVLVEARLDDGAPWMLRGSVRFVRSTNHCLVIEYVADREVARHIAAFVMKHGARAAERQLLACDGDRTDRAQHERERAAKALGSLDDDELRRERQS